MESSVIDVFRQVFSLLDARERLRFLFLTVLMVVVALIEVAGVSSVLILLNVLANPESITTNPWLSWAYGLFDFQSNFSFQVALALLVTGVVIFGLAIKAIGNYTIVRFGYMRGAAIATRLLGRYLSQPYAWFLERNSSETSKNVLTEVDGLVVRVITPLLRLTSNIILVLATIGFLMVVDPQVTLLSSVLLGGSYALIYLRMRGKLHQSGKDIMTTLEMRYRIAQEATGGIKDVKLLNLEPVYSAQFAKATHLSAQAATRVGIISELPRYFLEAITFGGLLALVLLLLFRSDGNIAGIVPTLGIFAFSVMRLLPALQQIYHGLATIRGGTPVLHSIAADYHAAGTGGTSAVPATQTLRLDEKLDLSKVSFKYASAERQALNGLDLTIPARTTIGIVGGTGAGKTTLIDLILGLLTPDSGEIRVDGTLVTPDNLRAWQKTLGYVPQSIFLTDDTIAANIAFGVPKEAIDRAALERAARAAALHDFVTTELAQGYDTLVGERGVRLSGGQRQRIGIARALYRSPSLLIMDEATSALDNITERVVMEAVQNIRADTTIILIAHRLTTVRGCDRIFLMEKGGIAASGTYDELVQDNATFRAMAVGA
ncbi:MAG: ABC transporter ATP-binding protein [Rhodobacteraceae bacterium]|jgi:ABC-type multidrug transport system fused ATPase/permease subunit|nr:ABC transporter ATP-binding protein [Paracoccaceae bacterium]